MYAVARIELETIASILLATVDIELQRFLVRKLCETHRVRQVSAALPMCDCLCSSIRAIQDSEGPYVVKWIMDRVLCEFNTWIPGKIYAGAIWVRLSAQIYLEIKEFEWAAGVLRDLCDRVVQGQWRSPLEKSLQVDASQSYQSSCILHEDWTRQATQGLARLIMPFQKVSQSLQCDSQTLATSDDGDRETRIYRLHPKNTVSALQTLKSKFRELDTDFRNQCDISIALHRCLSVK